MRKLFLLLIFWLFALDVHLVDARGLEFQKRIEGFDIFIRLERNPPVLGENPLEVEIRETEGKLLSDAEVLVNYYMPPMPRMAPMNYKTAAAFSKGKYRTSMNFIMSGPWVIRILITRNGKISVVKLNVDAQ